MDVRAKQRLSYRTGLVNSELRVGGFAPRHLNRSASALNVKLAYYEKTDFEYFVSFHILLGSRQVFCSV